MPRNILAIGFALVAGAMLSCSEAEKEPPITRIVIHYIGWWIETRISMSCDNVVRQGDSVVISGRREVEDFLPLSERLALKTRPGYTRIDVRICVVFYDSTGVVTKRIGVTRANLVEIDGKVFEEDGRLLDRIVSYLPKNYLKPPY